MNESLNKLIRIGLIYWIRNQCQSIEKIILEIEILLKGFLNFQVKDLYFSAEDIVFNEIRIDKLNLKTDSIKLKLNTRERKDSIISIKDEFQIKGELFFREDSINKILKSKSWEWLNVLLTKTFFEQGEFLKVKFKNNLLTLEAIDLFNQRPVNKDLILKAIDGKLVIKDSQSSAELILPMDESININNINLINGYLSVQIDAKVKV